MQGPVLWKDIGTGLGNNTDIPKPEHSQHVHLSPEVQTPTPVCLFLLHSPANRTWSLSQ